MINVPRFRFAQDLQGVDLFHKFGIRVSETWVKGVTLVNINDFHSHYLGCVDIFATDLSARAHNAER